MKMQLEIKKRYLLPVDVTCIARPHCRSIISTSRVGYMCNIPIFSPIKCNTNGHNHTYCKYVARSVVFMRYTFLEALC